MTNDYSINMVDSQGRTVTLSINGASIDEAIAAGSTEAQAREDVESDAFIRAIAAGNIGDDAWIAAA